MHFVKKVVAQAEKVVNSANLTVATNESLTASEAIKTRVREKLAKISADQKQTAEYTTLSQIGDKIEANHDIIYKRPDNGVNPSSAQQDCKNLLVTQEALEQEFNLAYAKLTGDPAVAAENAAAEASKKTQEAADAAQTAKDATLAKATEVKDATVAKATEVKDATVAKANEVAEEASVKTAGIKEQVADKAADLGSRVEEAASGVKEAFTRPKP